MIDIDEFLAETDDVPYLKNLLGCLWTDFTNNLGMLAHLEGVERKVLKRIKQLETKI